MTDAEIPGAIELLVGLLGLAAFVAIVVRRLRVPYTVALVIAGLLVGLGRRRRRVPADRRLAGPGPARPAAGPRLRGGLPAAHRRAPSLVRRPRAAGDPGCPDLGRHRRGRADARDRTAHRALVHRRRHGVGHRSGGRRGHVQASPRATGTSTMVDGESLLNDGTGLVLFALAVQAVGAPLGPGEAIVSFVGHDRAQPRDRARHRLSRGAGDGPRRRPSRRADDLGRAGLRQPTSSRTSSTCPGSSRP